MAKDKGHRRHDRIATRLEEKLQLEGNYQTWQFLEYNKSDRFVRDMVSHGTLNMINPIGEIDLLRLVDGCWEFYEIKSYISSKARCCAKRQYARFRDHFKRDRIVGFLYSGQRIQPL